MVEELYVPNDADYIISPCATGNFVVELWNGSNTSQILTRTYDNLSTTFQTYVITLTAGERAAITSWDNLTIHLSVNGSQTSILRMRALSTPDASPVILYIRARSTQW